MQENQTQFYRIILSNNKTRSKRFSSSENLASNSITKNGKKKCQRKVNRKGKRKVNRKGKRKINRKSKRNCKIKDHRKGQRHKKRLKYLIDRKKSVMF